MKRVAVTGSAGFIGSNLIKELIREGNEVIGIDNLRTGRIELMRDVINHPKFEFRNKDLLLDVSIKDFEGVDTVYHLAANADIRQGWKNQQRDFEQNTVATLKLIEILEQAKVEELVFTSTGSIYGESSLIPTPEDAPFPLQTSLYAASKLSAEAFIQAYAEAGRFRATIFRLVSVLGPHYSHGHVRDFVEQLIRNPNLLKVLGNGNQRKSYMHVDDCVRGLAKVRTDEKIAIFNLGQKETCTVRESISWILEVLNIQPAIEFGTETRGWIGDNPVILLDVSRAEDSGWTPIIPIEEAIKSTVKWVVEDITRNS